MGHNKALDSCLKFFGADLSVNQRIEGYVTLQAAIQSFRAKLGIDRNGPREAFKEAGSICLALSPLQDYSSSNPTFQGFAGCDPKEHLPVEAAIQMFAL